MPTKAKKVEKKILGIDPGTNYCGFAVIHVIGDKIHILEMGAFVMKSISDPYEKLRKIFLDTQEVIENHVPESVAVESPFYGKNVQSMLKLGRAQGVAIAAAMTMGLDITEYAPKKIKQSITGNGNSSKEQVAAMLKSIVIGKVDDSSLDASDALAVAVCHHFQSGRTHGIGGKKHNNWSSFLSDNPGRIG